MLRPDLFGGLASHAGDSLYEYCYIPEFATIVRTLRDKYEGSYERVLGRLPLTAAVDQGARRHAGDVLRRGGVLLGRGRRHRATPVRRRHRRLIPEVWDRWLAWDPVRMVPRYAEALRGLRAIYIDAGTRTSGILDLGARRWSALSNIGVTDVYFELFDATHTAIDYRYPTGLKYLAERLSPSSPSP